VNSNLQKINYVYVPINLKKFNDSFDHEKRKSTFYNSNIPELVRIIENSDKDKVFDLIKDLKINEIKAILMHVNSNYKQLKPYNFGIILKYKFRRSLSDLVYNIFLNYFDNNTFIEEINDLLDKASNTYTNNNKDIINKIKESSVVDYLVGKTKKKSFKTILIEHNIKNNTKLAENFFEGVIINGTYENIKQLNEKDITYYMENLNTENFIKITDNYIKKVKLNESNQLLPRLVFDRFDKPDSNNIFWKNISNNTKEVLKGFYNKLLIDKSFGRDERSLFWREFSNYIKDLVYNEENRILFMTFNKFTVIEFVDIGNAAYIYTNDIYSKYFKKYSNTKDSIYNSILKDKEKSITKVNHKGSWQNKMLDVLIKAGLQ